MTECRRTGHNEWFFTCILYAFYLHFSSSQYCHRVAEVLLCIIVHILSVLTVAYVCSHAFTVACVSIHVIQFYLVSMSGAG